MVASSAFGATKTWIGGSGSWNSAANWSPSGVPGSNDAIIIASGSPSFTSTTLTINSSGSITLSNNATLTVTGNISINGDGTLVINGGNLDHQGNQFNFPYSAIANVVIYSGTLSTTAGNFKVNSRMEMYGGRFLAKDGLAIQSGKTFIAYAGYIQIDGELDIQASASYFHAGNDSLVINGNLSVGSGCYFYGDSSVIIVNGMGSGNVKNTIYGTFYTNAATVDFNPNATTDIGSGGKFYGNSGTVNFNDLATIGNNGQLYVDSATIIFIEDLTVAQSGSIDAGSGRLTFQGDAAFQNSGTLNAGSATINFEGTASFNQSGTLNAGTSTLNFEGNASFSNSGTLNAGSAEVNFGGDVIISNNGGTINADNSTMTISGDINNAGTFNAGTSTVILDGDSNQTISSDITFYNLTIQTEGTVVAGGNVTVTNGGVIGPNSEFVMPDPNDQINVQGDLIDSSGTLASNTNKPFVVSIEVNNSTEIVVVFNETVTAASAENAANSSWTGRTISSRTRIDTNRLRLIFTPAISQNVEYTLTFQNIQNIRNPVGTMSAGHSKKFTWEPPAAPTVAASNLSINGSSDTSISLTWTNGNGSSRIVFARAGTQITNAPSNGSSYAASATFGAGDALSNMFAVYQGSGNSVTVSGLESNKSYVFVVYEFNGTGTATSYLTSSAPILQTNTHVRLDIKIFLEGPYASGYMRTDLNDVIPDTQVYATSPWFYTGTESVNGMPNDSVVDWVLVELRQASLPNQATDTAVVGRRAGFLLSNGKIVDLDGVSPLLIHTSRAGRMYAVVYHWSHLPVQSADSIDRTNGKFTYDFTPSSSFAYGNSPMKALDVNNYGMYCGRITGDIIELSSRIAVWNARNSTGYQQMDVNMDGVVDAGDRAQIWNNRNVESETAE